MKVSLDGGETYMDAAVDGVRIIFDEVGENEDGELHMIVSSEGISRELWTKEALVDQEPVNESYEFISDIVDSLKPAVGQPSGDDDRVILHVSDWNMQDKYYSVPLPLLGELKNHIRAEGMQVAWQWWTTQVDYAGNGTVDKPVHMNVDANSCDDEWFLDYENALECLDEWDENERLEAEAAAEIEAEARANEG